MLLGSLSPGDRLLSEREMAAQFGVSRSSVRSAIAALDQIGVVEVRHGVGTFVSVDTTRLHNGILPWAIVRGVEGLHDLYEVRRHVEVKTAGLAAESRTSDALTTLGQIIAAMREFEQGPEEEFLRWDMQFHVLIAESTGNKAWTFLCRELLEIVWDMNATFDLDLQRFPLHMSSA